MPQTPNHDYNVPNKGDPDWHDPLNENFESYDTDIEVRDTRSNRSNYQPKAGAKFVATDTEEVFVGDGSSWEKFTTSGKRPRLSGLDIGGSEKGIANFISPGGDYAVFAQSTQSSLGSAVISINDGSAGDGLQAISENDGRSAIYADAESNTDYGVLSDGRLGVGDAADPPFEVETTGTVQFDTPSSSGTREPMLRMFPDGTDNDDQPVVVHSTNYSGWGLFYNDTDDDFEFRANSSPQVTVNLDTGSVSMDGDLTVNGNKNFAQTVDTDDGEKEVVYTATEAPTPRTEASGVAELEDGRAEVDLPEHFGWVTDDDEPVVVETTPYSAKSAGLAVVERSPDRLVVEDLDGDGDYEFAYTVRGTRDGHADKQVVREPSTDPSGQDQTPSPADD